MVFSRNSMEFSCVFGVGFAIDLVSKNRDDFHGFSQTAWKNVRAPKPCQSVESSMTSRQNRLPQFSRNTKIRKKRQKPEQKSIQKMDSKKSEKHAKIMQKSDATPGSLQKPVSDQFWKHFGRVPGGKIHPKRKKGCPKRM